MQIKLIKTRARCCRSILPERQVAWTRPVICVPVITFAWLAADHAWNSLCRNKYVNLTYTHTRTHTDVCADVYALECKYCPCESALPHAPCAASSRSSAQEMFIAFIVAIVISSFFSTHWLLNREILKRSNLSLTRSSWNINSNKLCPLVFIKCIQCVFHLFFLFIAFQQWKKK